MIIKEEIKRYYKLEEGDMDIIRQGIPSRPSCDDCKFLSCTVVCDPVKKYEEIMERIEHRNLLGVIKA